MTKPPPPRPEPSTDTGYDSYLVPRSKTPAKTSLYEYLLTIGWRFDSHTMLWHTPERDTLQGCGALQYNPDVTWAKVQPPMEGPELGTLPKPLIELERVRLSITPDALGGWVQK